MRNSSDVARIIRSRLAVGDQSEEFLISEVESFGYTLSHYNAIMQRLIDEAEVAEFVSSGSDIHIGDVDCVGLS